MRDRGLPSATVLRELDAAWREDAHFRDGRILGSMCTAPAPIARGAHARFLEVNLGNPRYYPGTRRLEREVIGMLGALLHGRGVDGFMVSGGTEANLTALWIARNTNRRREVLFPASAHFSIRKAIDLLDLRPVEVELDSDYRMDVGDLRRKLSRDAAAVVAVAGTTELGQVDPVDEIAKVTRGRWFLHVDAAFGGFVLPFLRDLGHQVPEFDFKLPQVSTLCADPHKMGLGTVPCGSLTVRRQEWLDAITFDSPYLTKAKQGTLLGTRGSAAVPAAFAAMVSLGRDGYRRIVKDCMANTRLLAEGFRDLGAEPIIEPVMNILGVRAKDVPAAVAAFAGRGWNVSTTRIPSLRFVVMPHVTKAKVGELLDDARKLRREGLL